MTKVDLIIPTYNRPELLKRLLAYYNNYNVDFNIIIADSSNSINKKINKKYISSFSQLKILYVDKFPEKQVSHHKFGEMIKFAKSKYCVFCPDDDFIVPNGIKQCVDFLEKNSDYSVAHGTYISFYLYKNPYGSIKFWWRFIYPFNSITSSNPSKRLASHLTDYYQVLWAVRRTDVVKKAYEEFLKSKVNPYLFGELLPDMLTLVYGKMKKLNNFYAARQAFSTSYSYWPSLFDVIKEGIYDKEYSKFRDCIVKNLMNYGFSKEKLLLIIDQSMKKYLRSTQQEHLTGRFNLILEHFPSFVKKSIKLLHLKYLFLKKNKDKIGLIDNPYSIYFNDFNEIRKSVIKN